MRKTYNLFFICMVTCLQLIIVSCREESSKFIEGAKIVEAGVYEVAQPVDVQPLSCQTDGSIIGAVAIHDIGSGQALLQMMSGDHCFTWIDLATGETQDIVQRGRGPEEMVDAGFAGYRVNENGETEVVAYSIASPKMVCVNLTQSLAAGRTVITAREKLPRQTMYVLADAKNLYCCIFGEDQTVGWHVIDQTGAAETVIHPFGKDGRVADIEKYFAATSISPDGNCIAMGMASFPRLFLLNKNTDDLAISLNKQKDDQILETMNRNDSDMGDCCLWTQVKENSVYCLVVSQESSQSSSLEETMLVFDMKGSLKSAVRIPQPITSFIVTDSGKSIVGITMDGLLIRVGL